MKETKACGVLAVRGDPIESFLLMRHHDRWDLPKGHLDEGETEQQCALRELKEETGIAAEDIELIPGFRWTTEYDVYEKRFNEKRHKTLVIFLGQLKREVPVVVTEHVDFRWFPWQPPHRIQERAIDPLLAAVKQFLTTETPRHREEKRKAKLKGKS